MQTYRTANATLTQQGRRHSRKFVQFGLAGLAGAIVLAGSGASVASASGNNAAAKALAQAEAKLTALEKGAPSGASVTETGSSLFYPLFQEWQTAAPLGLSINPASTGSGTGISSAESGTINIGASDAYLPPGAPSNMLNIPVVVSAQQVDYNIPGLKTSTHLRLNATILSRMYAGTITKWNDPLIAAVNKGIKLPSLTIVPLKRSDGSGDTFLFTSYLAFADPTSFVASSTGPTTSTTAFPSVPGEQSEKGNTGMLTACTSIPGCVAYIGVSYLREAHANKLGDAALLNGWKGRGGANYVLPTPQNIAAEVASFQKIPASGTLSLIFSHSARYGYPIANFEYAIVNKSQSSTNTANAIKALLAWGMDPRNGASSKYLTTIYFQPLAVNALNVAIGLLQQIGG